MFLFLSKLLPLLVYPLGLGLVLLMLAWIWAKKRRNWARGAIAAAFLILWLGSTPLLKNSLVASLEQQNLPPRQSQELPQAAAIVLLGGATKSADPPRPSVEISEEGDRVIHAARLFRLGKAPVVIPSGGRISWQGSGGPSEALDMVELLTFMGVPEGAIIPEPDSLNTRQNAVNVQRVLRERGIAGPLLLVTSAMHMPRSLAIFRKLGMEVVAAPTDFWVAGGDRQRTVRGRLLSLLPDVENLRLTTRAMKEYMGLVVYRLRGWL